MLFSPCTNAVKGAEASSIAGFGDLTSPENDFFRIPDRLFKLFSIQQNFSRITNDDAIGAN